VIHTKLALKIIIGITAFFLWFALCIYFWYNLSNGAPWGVLPAIFSMLTGPALSIALYLDLRKEKP
jgi:hypothetical protein